MNKTIYLIIRRSCGSDGGLQMFPEDIGPEGWTTDLDEARRYCIERNTESGCTVPDPDDDEFDFTEYDCPVYTYEECDRISV